MAAQEVNGARGEVALAVAGFDLVIAATMKGLASLSTELGCKSFGDLFERLAGGEIVAAQKAVRYLTVKGDGAAASEAMELSDMPAVVVAVNGALAHHLAPEKNGEAAKATEAEAPAE